MSKNRLTVVETIYHEQEGESPTSTTSRYSRLLESTEQKYYRLLKVGEQWTKIDTAWIDQCSLLSLRNETGKALHVRPRNENYIAAQEAVIEVAFREDDSEAWLILPGESLRANPARLDKLLVRCRKGTARLVVNVIPY